MKIRTLLQAEFNSWRVTTRPRARATLPLRVMRRKKKRDTTSTLTRRKRWNKSISIIFDLCQPLVHSPSNNQTTYYLQLGNKPTNSYISMFKATGSVYKEADLTVSQSRRNNPIFRSQFLNNSVHKDREPEIRHTFFHDKPFEKVREDLVRYRPVSYESPHKAQSRSYVVVEQQVKYGKPMTAEEFEALISRKLNRPEVITYGPGDKTNLKDNVRLPIDIKKETKQQKSGWCCCGDEREQKKALVERYE